MSSVTNIPQITYMDKISGAVRRIFHNSAYGLVCGSRVVAGLGCFLGIILSISTVNSSDTSEMDLRLYGPDILICGFIATGVGAYLGATFGLIIGTLPGALLGALLGAILGQPKKCMICDKPIPDPNYRIDDIPCEACSWFLK
jgi:hypothetical protein